MIKARHTRLGRLFFDQYSRIQLHRYFRTVRIVGEFNDRNLPVLMLGNHFTWWDGFIQLFLNNCRFQRKFHVMMLEEQLQQHRILTKAGAFSIKKGTRETLHSLTYCESILKHPENLLLLFPQGEIQSLYTREYKFERGMEILLNRLKYPVHLIFNVNLVDYFAHKKPGLRIYYTEYDLSFPADCKTIERAYNDFALTCIHKQSMK